MTETNIIFNDNDEEKQDINGELDDLDIDVKNKELTKTDKKGGVTLNKQQLNLARNLLTSIKENSTKLADLLGGRITPEEEARISIGQIGETNMGENIDGDSSDSRIVEGVFDGENMIGPDGKQYSVPANYASKSKLVEGDILKLTITANGTFVYKQIGPIERTRVVGKLRQADSGGYLVEANGKHWRVLTASVTYFKGQEGDEIIILIPKTGDSKWAAVENIVRNKE